MCRKIDELWVEAEAPSAYNMEVSSALQPESQKNSMMGKPTLATASVFNPCRSGRSDAQRNSERLVAIARETFAERGTDAPLEEIAKRAGVGIGTLYRHFPTRQDLVQAVMADQILALTARAVELAEDANGTEDALAQWLTSVVEHISSYRGFAKSMAIAMNHCADGGASLCSLMNDAGRRLLERCQQRGEVRSDVEIGDVIAIVNGLAWTVDAGASASVDRLLSVMLDGLRPQAITSRSSLTEM